MSALAEAVRAAYFDALGGHYQTMPMHEHQRHAFDHLARGIERACDAAQAWRDPRDVEGMRAAALAAFAAETFTDHLARTLPDEEYRAVLARADHIATYRIHVRAAQARGETPPLFVPLAD